MKVHAGIAMIALVIGLVAGASLAGSVDIGSDDPIVVAAEAEESVGTDTGEADRRDEWRERRGEWHEYRAERWQRLDDADGDRRGWGGHHCAFVERWSEHRDDLLEDFAAELGVTPDEVVEAARSVAESRLNAAVEDGRISQEKADRILGMIEDPGALCED